MSVHSPNNDVVMSNSFSCPAVVVEEVGRLAEVVQSSYRCSMGIVVPALEVMVLSNSGILKKKNNFVV